MKKLYALKPMNWQGSSSFFGKTNRGYLSTVAMLAAFLLFFSYGAQAQNYQTVGSGDWNDVNTWAYDDGSGTGFVSPAPTPPNRTDGTILIQSGHEVNVTANVTVDQVTVNGTINILTGITFRIFNDASGDDLIVGTSGQIVNSGNVAGRANDPGALGSILVNGTFTNVDGGNLNTNNLSSLVFGNGATYIHDRNGGSLPLNDDTNVNSNNVSWEDGSTCSIIGIVDDNPNNTNQTFGNFEWNCSEMTGTIVLIGPLETQGDFSILSTGTAGILRYNSDLLSVGRNFVMRGVEFRLGNGTIDQTLDINGNFDMATGNLILSTNTSSGTMNVAGNLMLDGGSISEVGSGPATINFDGSSLQSFQSGGAFSGTINFAVATDASLTFGNLSAGGSVDLSGSNGTFINNGTLLGSFPSVDSPTDVTGNAFTPPTGGPLQSNGTLAPGNSVGTFVIIGDLILAGTLSVEIEGPGFTEYDRVIVTGEADISGASVDADFGTYVPASDPEIYQVVAASTYTGGSPAFFAGVGGTAANFTFTLVDHTDGGIRVEGIALPVNLISFTAERVGANVELNWRTAQEINNDYMAIERADHSLQFEEIGRVAGVGTTSEVQNYDFTDFTPLPGANYYRLRQVDMDGTMEYHEVIYLDFSDRSTSSSLEVYPNPAVTHLRANWAAGEKENVEIRIFSTSGQLLSTHRVSGDNATFELPVQQLSPGTYLLQLQRKEATETIRFIKQ